MSLSWWDRKVVWVVGWLLQNCPEDKVKCLFQPYPDDTDSSEVLGLHV